MPLPDPQDLEALLKTDIDFPRLEPDSPEHCPVTMTDIQEYLRYEDADLERVGFRTLRFLRTARVDGTAYWIWDYRESDGTRCFVTVSLTETESTLGMDDDREGLSPEQFILGDYLNMF